MLELVQNFLGGGQGSIKIMGALAEESGQGKEE
jgi:hypothetical protein